MKTSPRHILTRAFCAYFIKPAIWVVATVGVGSFLFSCRHKDLFFENPERRDFSIVFDWRNDPDANPASMAVMLFPSTGDQNIRFDFTGRDGGHVTLPPDTYMAIAFNSDNTDWIRFSNTDDYDNLELFTGPADVLPASGAVTRNIPRAPEASEEPHARTPETIWTDSQENLILNPDDKDKVFTFYPEDGICYYTVDILDVKNIRYSSGSEIDATLSGMSRGWHPGRKCTSSSKVTYPFTLTGDIPDSSLHGEFKTLGEVPNDNGDHFLSVYLILSDGSKRYYSYKVTDQIRNAPDPRHVHIIVRGLDIPQPISSGSGLIPDVNDWSNVDVGLDMGV